MKYDIFKIRISKIPFLLSILITISSASLSLIIKIQALKLALFIFSCFIFITIPIVFYNTIFTRLTIKNNTLVGFNGLFSRIKIPVSRITVVSISRPPIKMGGRSVILLTRARDLIKIRYVSNYEELLDALENLNKNIEIDKRFYNGVNR
ncbi:hypothetical protein [Fusobacterium gastrosuis]|uniref:hypothetical protein n=1 Tax=Fusobacterium gastrosuis TaxID=1755100 RepID=UPI002973A38D|nr:hypothetical protein [Fusobacteriaceae bacterium]MDY5714288.1 hypothetical protein [Fusobacterium gastrosuis]